MVGALLLGRCDLLLAGTAMARIAWARFGWPIPRHTQPKPRRGAGPSRRARSAFIGGTKYLPVCHRRTWAGRGWIARSARTGAASIVTERQARRRWPRTTWRHCWTRRRWSRGRRHRVADGGGGTCW